MFLSQQEERKQMRKLKADRLDRYGRGDIDARCASAKSAPSYLMSLISLRQVRAERRLA